METPRPIGKLWPADQVAQRLLEIGLAEQHNDARREYEKAEDTMLQLERWAMEAR